MSYPLDNFWIGVAVGIGLCVLIAGFALIFGAIAARFGDEP